MTVSFYFSIDNLGEDPGTLLEGGEHVPRKTQLWLLKLLAGHQRGETLWISFRSTRGTIHQFAGVDCFTLPTHKKSMMNDCR